ncbi:MAG: hypothetical protein ACLP50_27810 [Solirubrobacteraceae bacterium]
MSEPSILDARLAEIDRRLRMIQSGLEPAVDREQRDGHRQVEAPAGPAAGDVAPPPSRAADVAPTPAVHESAGPAVAADELAAVHERLLGSARELEAALARASRAAGAISVSAAPFESSEAVRRFGRALAELPDVRDVAVREYQGEDRVVFEVQLRSQPTS